MALNEHYAIAHGRSVPELRAQGSVIHKTAEPAATSVATLCDKRTVRHTLEIQVSASGNSEEVIRMRVESIPTLDNLIALISNGRDALELNGASPVRVNFSQEDYVALVARIANQQDIAVDKIEKVWLASVRVEKSARTTAGRLQLVGADGSVLNLNWNGEVTPREAAALPSTIHPVDFSNRRR
ncbi:MAG: hypothetical protein IT366_06350 [Candidatus Hydrogenedentes bacterium]|nr:hypothetical protein [Candidatus Hydrogenedentota bacterium]